jgi:uncharacterized protein YgbK (DUF1537 family)
MTDPLFCFYGDDVTGSTDALEALAAGGVPSVLFLDAPSDELLERFAWARAFGIAGESRSHNPAWMDETLPPVFTVLKRSGAPLCQYKICSTFDSSPEFGSIGRAAEIGRQVFGDACIPVVVAAPHLKRYVIFGNLFAASEGTIHRIDRHPTMRHHPVTPMDEADLRHHLSQQTSLRIDSFDIVSIESGAGLPPDPSPILLFDGLSPASVVESANLIWSSRGASPSFCIGSSGLTRGLISCWRKLGLIGEKPPQADLAPAEQIIVLSGSCSPITARQIGWAQENGFTTIRVSDAALPETLEALKRGESVVVYSASGHDDRRTLLPVEELGGMFGWLLMRLLRESPVRRVVLAGGDTSSQTIRRLGLQALTFAGVLTPGAPLCLAHSSDPATNGLELVLKGGQIGPENFFETVGKGKE